MVAKIDAELEGVCKSCMCDMPDSAENTPCCTLASMGMAKQTMHESMCTMPVLLCGKMFLIMSDAHSKWLEVHMTTTTTSAVTIDLVRKSFASLGLPEVIVSDNAIYNVYKQ